MKLAVMTLLLCAAAAVSPGVSAFDHAKLVQQRIDRLEDEQSRINQESHDLGGGMTVRASIRAVTGNRDRITRQIDDLDATIQQLQALREDLVRSRILRDEKNIYAREDGREELAQHIGETVFLIGVSEAAKRFTGAVGATAFVGESVYRYSRKWENLAQLDELIATNDRNLADLRNLRSQYQIARGEELRKLARLQELRRRDLELLGELGEARAHLARLQAPPPAAAPVRTAEATTPRPPAPRAPTERVIYPMELAGAWTGSGYNCNGAEPDEFIFIRISPDGGLIATKSSGDECVHAGEVTWTGKLEGKQIRGRFHARARNAPANADSWIDGTLDVVSVNEIQGFGVRFHRPAVR